MKKKIFTLSNLVLSSLITALGFGACKTTKTSVKENISTNAEKSSSEDTDNDESKQPTDSITPIPKRPGGEIRVLYGPPPTRLTEKIKK